ncbi:MAG TPA: hypothetical protein VJN32_04885 [Dehalococcoidia bacterium]|nr:hypothetical protein [Dehalococcoidia bacterium]
MRPIVSLVVTVYVPSGIVMAGDSRMTVLRTEEKEEDGKKLRIQQQIVLSDNAYKVVALTSIGVGISVYDAGVINNEPVDSHVHRFEEEAITPEDDAASCAEKFLAYFKTNHPSVPIGFHVAGYKLEGRASTPFVFVGHTTKQEASVNRVNVNAQGKVQYGILRSGDIQVVNRLIEKTQLPLFAAMPLQDAVDYAVHLIRTTIDTMRFEPRFPGVGGAIDVLAVTPAGMRWVQRKELRGEGWPPSET